MTPLKAASLLELQFVSDPQLSPDGSTLFAVHTRIDKGEEDAPPSFKGQIYRYNLSSGEVHAFTEAGSSAKAPRLSPKGDRLAFLSDRDKTFKKPQLYLMPTSGGEAERVTGFKDGVLELAWRPDGEAIAFTSRGDYEDEAAKHGRARTITRMHYKSDGTGFRATAPAQIYLLTLATGEIQKLTELDVDAGGLAWSPDGQSLYFTAANNIEEADFWYSHLWRLSPGGSPELVMTEGPKRVALPSVSLDGKRVAFYSSIEDNIGAPAGLWTVDSDGSGVTLHTGELDMEPRIAGDSRYGALPTRACWSEDGGTLYTIANRRGASNLIGLELASGKITELQQGQRAVTGFAYAAGRFAFTAETPDKPGDLYLLENGRERILSDINRGFMDAYELAQASEEQHATSTDGTPVPYWVLTPKTPREDGALVLQIHGGPHTDYGYGFMLEFQLMAAEGYTVVYGNPRGSSSYGKDYAITIQGRYGSIDADDIMAVAEDARKNHAKPEAPIHLTGGSYGGFMTNWLLSHTDLFRSAVTQRSICNWLSFYGSSDIGYRFSEQEVKGNPWDNLEELWNQSPLKYVTNITTPLLIIHSEEDHRCPIEQGEQLFIALKRIGKAETKFIRFPGEGHELSRSGRPDRQIERLNAIIDWFKEHA